MSCVCEVISSIRYILKVKLNLNIYPNILSEIIGLHENEGRGGNWLNSLIDNQFTLGGLHSAV